MKLLQTIGPTLVLLYDTISLSLIYHIKQFYILLSLLVLLKTSLFQVSETKIDVQKNESFEITVFIQIIKFLI